MVSRELVEVPSGAPLVPLSPEARRYIHAARSPRTLALYVRCWSMFLDWLDATGRPSSFPASFPVSARTLVEYLTARADAGLKVATIELDLAAITDAHKTAGFPSPRDLPLVRETWRGIRRTLSIRQRQVDPLLADDLVKICRVLPETLTGLRDRALLTIGFTCALRRSEISALDIEDVFVSETRRTLRVTVRRSKTDQAGEGAVVTALAAQRHPEACPVAAFEAWVEAMPNAAGPLFRGIRGTRIRERLHPQMVAHIVKDAVTRAGLDPSDFSGHSLRRGFATSAAIAGRPDRLIQWHGRWERAEMVDRYVGDVYSERESALKDVI